MTPFPAHKLKETKIQFPAIYAKLELFWGQPEFDSFILSLIIVEKDKARQGFPVVIIDELLSVYNK